MGAARKPPLRVVEPGEKPSGGTKRRKLTITEAVAKGTVREQLEALRDRVATTVQDPNCPARDLAALSRRLMEITREIEAIDAAALEEGEEGGVTPDETWEAI